MFEIPIITPLFGIVVKFLYNTFGQNYLLTLFLFAVIMKIVLLPFGIKQQKNSIKQSKLRPKEMAIRNKYKGRNDKATQQKMQEEIMKLYQEENFNPMAGCLPLLLQMPILFALYAVIVNPLTHISGFDKQLINDNIQPVIYEVNEMLNVDGCDDLKGLMAVSTRNDQIGILNQVVKFDNETSTKIIVDENGVILAYSKDGNNYFTPKNEAVQVNKDDGNKAAELEMTPESDAAVSEEIVPAVSEETVPAVEESQENVIIIDGVKVRETTVSEIFEEKLGEKVEDADKKIDEIKSVKESFVFFGLDLTETGRIDLSVYVLIPLLTFLFSFFSTKVIRKFTYQPQMAASADPSQKASMGMMDWMMPLLSVWISLSISSAIAIYWMFQNVLSAVQQIVLFKLYPIPPVTEEMIKEAELQLKGKSKKNEQVVLSDDDFDDYDKTDVTDKSSNNRKKSGIISSRKMNKLNPKVKEIYKQGRHLTAKKKI